MKKIISIIFAAALAFSCDKGDGAADYGNILLYIPQAMTNGTVDNVYPVPSGADVNTYNFKVEEGTVKVFLSVYRSGKIKASEVSVDVAVSAENSLTNATALGAEPMPASMYSLPSKVTVPEGENYCSFNLELKSSELLSEANAGKTFVLCIAISNPSKYSLNENASEVIVKLEVNEMKSHL